MSPPGFPETPGFFRPTLEAPDYIRPTLAGQTFNGLSDGEMTVANALTFAALNKGKAKVQADEANRNAIAAANAQVAAHAATDALTEPERRQRLADAILAHTEATTAHTAALAAVARASEQFQSAAAQVDRLADVPSRVTAWIAQRISSDLPIDLPADLRAAQQERGVAEERSIALASAVASLQAKAGATEQALHTADRARITAASSVVAVLGDSIASDLHRALDAAASHRSALTTLLTTFLGGTAIHLSLATRQALDRVLGDPATDHMLQAGLAGWHADLLDNADARGPFSLAPEHEWLRVDDSQVQVVKAGQQ